MTMSHESRSAEIYQFPLRGRFAVSGKRDDSNSVSGVASPRVATTAAGRTSVEIREAEVRRAERLARLLGALSRGTAPGADPAVG